MNQTLKYILIVGASALAGGVAGYFLRKKTSEGDFEQRVAEVVDKELADIRRSKSFTESSEPITPENQDIYDMIRNEFEEEAAATGTPLNEYRLQLLTQVLQTCRESNFDENETQAAIEKLMAETESPEEDEDDVPELFEDEPQLVMDEHAERPPEVLTMADYAALPSYFDFLTFHYFEDDDVLLDDGDMVVDDVERTVGDALVHFGECDENDDDTVYVVNGRMGLAIEIVRMHTSYSAWNGWGDNG